VQEQKALEVLNHLAFVPFFKEKVMFAVQYLAHSITGFFI
jgi:hypothetical protein